MGKQLIGCRLLTCLSRNFRLVAGTTVSTVFAVWLVSVFIYEPEFTATSQVFVEPSSSDAIHGEALALADYQTLEAYQVLAKSPAVISQVLESTSNSYSMAELHDHIAINRPDNSRILNIVVTAESKNEAAAVANALAYSLQEEVKTLLKVDNVSIVLKAGTSNGALEESSSLSVLLSLAAVAGMVGGILLSFALELVGFARKYAHLGRKKDAQLQTVFK
ncbi:Wzz/FepE/Etk N-terminal domain-containing protein [Planococcus maritimus]|uniref:Wzz/FepE/Etk N-terminal domain-containing protein n=1 Tax=Planococcus maritimus TaxID=192421 RepID=UPI00232FDAAB|nr:Wzz/FepE/Etk N-terminal domain-containing protein [Planococcus maritimus]